VHYESYGTGKEAVVFIHGWSCDLTFWRGQSPIYRKHRALLIDLPGHGKSDKPVIAYPAEHMARGVEAAMRDAGVERAVLVGHSLGGLIIHAFLRLFPENVKGIVFVDATFPLHQPTPAEREAYAARLAARADSLSSPEAERNFANRIEGFFSPMTRPALREEIRRKMTATAEHVRVAAVSSPSELEPPAGVETYPMPVLAMAAVKARQHFKTDGYRAFFTNFRFEEWRGYGHFLMMEDPVRFNRSVEKFLLALK
jgi:pimeloyl-ACP methyl ester carboxylesterase